MRRLPLLLAIAIASAPLLAAASPHPLTIVIAPEPGSKERGTAVLTQRGADLIVDIRVTGMPANTPSQLVHLHRGPCDQLSLHDAIGLDPLVSGRSRTVLRGADAKRALMAGTYYVSVHKMLANVSMHVACGGPVRRD